jgi:hypothetical protein
MTKIASIEDFNKAVHSGQIVFITEHGYSLPELELYKKVVYDPSIISFIGMTNPRRLGVLLFQTALEFFHYDPRTSKNDVYQIAYLRWQEMIFTITSIPSDDVDKAMVLADKCYLSISNGIPTTISDSIEQFPIAASNVKTLKNKKNHPIGDPFDEDARQLEENIVTQILDFKITELPSDWLTKGMN